MTDAKKSTASKQIKKSPTNQSKSKQAVNPLSDGELDQLESLLDILADGIDVDDVDMRHSLSLDGVDGLFAALALSPSQTPIGDWMSMVMGDASFADKETTQLCRNLLIRHHNAVIHQLRKTDMTSYEPCVVLNEQAVADVAPWCAGFAMGYERQEEKWEGRLDEPALAELNVILALKEADEMGVIEVADDLSEAEAEYRSQQIQLVELMRQEVAKMLGETVDNLSLLLFALAGLQETMLKPVVSHLRYS